VGLPVGKDGEYYVGSYSHRAWPTGRDVLDYNAPPSSQPSLWCQWIPSALGGAIVWDGAEKFYEYVPWLKYLIDRFLKPWGYTVNGEMEWQGESSDDRGIIVVQDNRVGTKTYYLMQGDVEWVGEPRHKREGEVHQLRPKRIIKLDEGD
jgi:hypothetical protein